jgi:hypothetical protein
MICLDDLFNYLTQETITLHGAVRALGAPQSEIASWYEATTSVTMSVAR